MKKLLILTVLVLLALALSISTASADKPTEFDPQGNEVGWESTSCTTIQDGTLKTSTGDVIMTGYDQWGYNYQAHMFNGLYCNYDRNSSDCSGDNTELIMKWNDAWLANVDCSGEGLLDRHFGFTSYIGSGAWETNHQKGTYEQDGQTCQWEYFVKIIAAPADATLVNGVWYAADGIEIGPAIWGDFAIIEEVSNDPCAGDHGILYLSPDHAGFGGW